MVQKEKEEEDKGKTRIKERFLVKGRSVGERGIKLVKWRQKKIKKIVSLVLRLQVAWTAWSTKKKRKALLTRWFDKPREDSLCLPKDTWQEEKIVAQRKKSGFRPQGVIRSKAKKK